MPVMAEFCQFLNIRRNGTACRAYRISVVRFVNNQHCAFRYDITKRGGHDLLFRQFVGFKLPFIQSVDMAEIKRSVYLCAVFQFHFEQSVFVVQNHRDDAGGFACPHVSCKQINHASTSSWKDKRQFFECVHTNEERECAEQVAQPLTESRN
ncbi:Uncharacterised protein [Neisseria meningitidis]|nr:Uncharacterised protein [Neisseria meningitidis]